MDNSLQNLLNVDQHKGLTATFLAMVVAGNRIHPNWFKGKNFKKVLLVEMWVVLRE